MGVLIGLLATTGLRPGEAFALGGEDVDLEDGVLVVRDSKFHKSRQVPLHTVMALHAYRKRRDRWFSTSPSAPFIACRPQGRLADKNVHYAFHQLLNQTSISCPTRPESMALNDAGPGCMISATPSGSRPCGNGTHGALTCSPCCHCSNCMTWTQR